MQIPLKPAQRAGNDNMIELEDLPSSRFDGNVPRMGRRSPQNLNNPCL